MKTRRHLLMLAVAAFLQTAPCWGGEPYRPFLELGKVWNYKYTYNDSYTTYHQAIGTLTYWIEGDSIMNGRHVFRICQLASEDDIVYKGWWYEEGGRVYSRGSDNPHYLLYDFSLSPGDTVVVKEYIDMPLVVLSVDTIFTHGSYRKRLHMNGVGGSAWLQVPWVEGIGNPERLDEPLFHEVSDGKKYWLVSCYVGDECVFEQSDFDAPPVSVAGMQHPRSFTRSFTDESVYDLTGRLLASPPARGLYIRGGRKYVVK